MKVEQEDLTGNVIRALVEQAAELPADRAVHADRALKLLLSAFNGEHKWPKTS
jgi:hypothetical protein